MKKLLILAIIGFSLFVIVLGCTSETEKRAAFIDKRVKSVIPILERLGTDAIITKAVKEANAEGKTLDQIKELDEKWKAAKTSTDYMKALMRNRCAQRIKAVKSHNTYYAEVFVMDNQGANVAMTDRTSDYWQGDEDKFIKSYNKGQGATHVGEVEFDESTKAYLIQISVPVKDGDKVIGAITFGVDVDKI